MSQAREAIEQLERKERSLLAVATAFLAAVLVALVIVLLLLVQSVRNAERRDAASNESHRKRNELIHGCVNAKIDKLRNDIAAFVQDPHSGFASDDGIHCPPIQP